MVQTKTTVDSSLEPNNRFVFGPMHYLKVPFRFSGNFNNSGLGSTELQSVFFLLPANSDRCGCG